MLLLVGQRRGWNAEAEGFAPFSLLLGEQLSALWADPCKWRKQARREDTDGRIDGWNGEERALWIVYAHL